MKIISKISNKVMRITSAFALMLAVSSITNMCFYWVHQPNVPDELKKYEV